MTYTIKELEMIRDVFDGMVEVKSLREVLKDNIIELLEDDEMLAYGNEDEIIYMIDDIKVYGGFEYGIRSVDHNILLDDYITWDHILKYGTVVVPESQTYISNDDIDTFERLGYKRLDLNNNHIMGFSS